MFFKSKRNHIFFYIPFSMKFKHHFTKSKLYLKKKKMILFKINHWNFKVTPAKLVMALNSSGYQIVRFAFFMKRFNIKRVEKVTYMQDVNSKSIVSFLMLA